MDHSFDVIVITCFSASLRAVEKEIKYMQKKCRIPEFNNVLVVEDPAENVGSGAATLNALVVATEYLSAQKNYMVVTADVLTNAHILILHHGRDYVYSIGGKAFISLPQEWSNKNSKFCNQHYASGVYTNLEMLLDMVDKLSSRCPPGVWVCSTDMMLLTKREDFNIKWDNVADAVLFCVLSDVMYATGHGTVRIDEQGHVADIIYCGSSDIVEKYKWKSDNVPLVSGIIFLSAQTAESLLSLHVQHPLDSCTYMGLDSGAEPIQVSLFFDILVAMATKVSKEEFLSGRCGKIYDIKAGFDAERVKGMFRARSLVWEELSKYRMTAEILEDCQHVYWTDQFSAKKHIYNLHSVASSGYIHSSLEDTANSRLSNYVVMNSIIKASRCNISSGTVVCHSHFQLEQLDIGEDCYISGITACNFSFQSLYIPKGTVVLGFYGKNSPNNSALVVFGIQDNLTVPISQPRSTFANKPWSELFIKLRIDENDLWDSNLEQSKRNLLTAKLYLCKSTILDIMLLVQENIGDSANLERWKSGQRVSLFDLMHSINYEKIFDHRRNIYAQISAEKIRNVLYQNKDHPLHPFFLTACAEGWHESLLHTLDSILMSETNTVILTRTLSCMADLLGSMAGKAGGLRSGPGGNKSWTTAFDFLLEGNIPNGVLELTKERAKWLDRPDHIMRAARHYERAAQILIHNSVKTVKKYMITSLESLPAEDLWLSADCPARIDLQGGWTDTPPICYELGGSVVNIAVLIDGKKPIGARARRKKEPSITLIMGPEDISTQVVIENIEDILDYNQPYAQGALLKAALICANIVDVHSNLSLNEQLMKSYNAGIEVQSWSLLPQGCGMGTSSILAGAIIAVLWSVSGKKFDNLAIIHAVLYVEQLLTTGGGWQDQVGGIMGSINRGFSRAALPLCVEVSPITVTMEFIEKLNKHFLLIYTGKVRLAKNLLQNVIRNWYARDKTIVDCFKNLVSSSKEMENALKEGKLEQVGDLMNRYWEQKKVLAPGCEPATVKIIMEHLNPVCYGQTLAGAGGGGFMCILTKQPEAIKAVKHIISKIKEANKITVHTVTVYTEGLKVTSQEKI